MSKEGKPRTIIVNWQPPSEANGKITGEMTSNVCLSPSPAWQKHPRGFCVAGRSGSLKASVAILGGAVSPDGSQKWSQGGRCSPAVTEK